MRRIICLSLIVFILQIMLTGAMSQNKGRLNEIEEQINFLETNNFEKEKIILEKSSCDNILQIKEKIASTDNSEKTDEIALLR